ncbi:RasGAP SH3 binding protein rasputin [Klebsormidium nitens]|uniref:RasGAP SH3 binding protein rasputin n=1 Tax=Klebsormidium nitens TaxID=105231 RepID=A0A1Y1HWF0_KLENI|nr:RasGAP SH3 binding protein rasputin [Klebsormidium nitens]|eukprot:GAQ81529.1 RasGAP SH3 binding protein rasputin [Klebsormidium nitens]
MVSAVQKERSFILGFSSANFTIWPAWELEVALADEGDCIREQAWLVRQGPASPSFRLCKQMAANDEIQPTGPNQPAAHVVGTSFVQQYYSILCHNTHHLHRFYTDASSFTRAEAGPEGEDQIDTVIGQKAIHAKVSSVDYREAKAEIRSVESQYSLNGGVIVLVTGSLFTKAQAKRRFVHTFFLAPQETGYFVLNDILRFLVEESEAAKTASTTASAATPHLANGVQEAGPEDELEPDNEPDAEQVTELVKDDEPEEVMESPPPVAKPKEVPPPPAEEEAMETAAEDEEPAAEKAPTDALAPEPEEQAAEKGAAAAAETGPMEVDPEPAQEDDKPKAPLTYAQTLRLREKEAAMRAAPAQAAAAEKARAQAPAPVEGAPTAPVSAPAPPEHAEEVPDYVERDSRSIFVKNLPPSAEPDFMQRCFSQFGVLKANGISIKRKESSTFAFLEFEDQASAQRAVESSPVDFEGAHMYIEQKHSGPNRGGRGGRGGPGGRGSDRPYSRDRQQGPRGPGGYSSGREGGRGGGRGGPPGERHEMGGRGRGPGPQGGHLGRSGSLEGGRSSSRGPADSQGGNRPPRRGGGGGSGGPPAPRTGGPAAAAGGMGRGGSQPTEASA